jgi:phenylpropionate dioxygenase-like ring-hydroxylating dioxygenase large terminal subunit
MIRNQWYAVLESNEVRRGKPVGVTRMGEKLVAWRDSQGKVTVMHDLCPHRGVALSVGEVHGDCIWCPFHGFEYDASGHCTLIPANGAQTPAPRAFRVQTYPAHEAHGLIFIYWGQPDGELPPPRWFADLDESFSYGSARDPWNAHYSRVIENQLDVPHVPFIHHNTIGRGKRTVMDGPWVEWQDPDRFFVYTWMRLEDGTPARRADEMAQPDKPFHLEFIFPNLWQNWIGPKVRVVAVFAPVDDENTVLYLRFYQSFMRTPGVRSLINRSAMIFNTIVAHQDRRVVVTQRPKPSSLRMGEKLIAGDGPIIAYRRRRQELALAPVARAGAGAAKS